MLQSNKTWQNSCLFYYSDGVFTHGVTFMSILDLEPMQVTLIIIVAFINLFLFSFSMSCTQIVSTAYFKSFLNQLTEIFYNPTLTEKEKLHDFKKQVCYFLLFFMFFFLAYFKKYSLKVFPSLWIVWVLSPTVVGFVYILLMAEAPLGIILNNVTLFNFPLYNIILHMVYYILLLGIYNLYKGGPSWFQNWMWDIRYFFVVIFMFSLFFGGLNNNF